MRKQTMKLLAASLLAMLTCTEVNASVKNGPTFSFSCTLQLTDATGSTTLTNNQDRECVARVTFQGSRNAPPVEALMGCEIRAGDESCTVNTSMTTVPTGYVPVRAVTHSVRSDEDGSHGCLNLPHLPQARVDRDAGTVEVKQSLQCLVPY